MRQAPSPLDQKVLGAESLIRKLNKNTADVGLVVDLAIFHIAVLRLNKRGREHAVQLAEAVGATALTQGSQDMVSAAAYLAFPRQVSVDARGWFPSPTSPLVPAALRVLALGEGQMVADLIMTDRWQRLLDGDTAQARTAKAQSVLTAPGGIGERLHATWDNVLPDSAAIASLKSFDIDLVLRLQAWAAEQIDGMPRTGPNTAGVVRSEPLFLAAHAQSLERALRAETELPLMRAQIAVLQEAIEAGVIIDLDPRSDPGKIARQYGRVVRSESLRSEAGITVPVVDLAVPSEAREVSLGAQL